MVAIKRKEKSVRLTPQEAVAVAAAVMLAVHAAPPPEDFIEPLEAVLDKLYDKFAIYECEDCGGLHAE